MRAMEMSTNTYCKSPSCIATFVSVSFKFWNINRLYFSPAICIELHQDWLLESCPFRWLVDLTSWAGIDRRIPLFILLSSSIRHHVLQLLYTYHHKFPYRGVCFSRVIPWFDREVQVFTIFHPSLDSLFLPHCWRNHVMYVAIRRSPCLHLNHIPRFTSLRWLNSVPSRMSTQLISDPGRMSLIPAMPPERKRHPPSKLAQSLVQNQSSKCKQHTR